MESIFKIFKKSNGNDIIFKMKSPCNMNITICTNESPVPLIGFPWVDQKIIEKVDEKTILFGISHHCNI